LSTKIHLAVNERGKAVRIILGPGQESDYKKAGELIYGFKASALLADKGYDANWLEEAARKQGINSIVIPSKSYRNPKRVYDKTLYRDRNIIERFFKRLKHYRRVASRFDKTARNFMAMTSIAATIINQML
jgi:putative transposase